MANTQSERAVRHLPMKPADYLTLIALGEGERHGYGLVKRIEELSDGTLKLVPGNFYSVLNRLMSDGLLEESDLKSAADLDGRRRRYYAITALGSEVAGAETARLKALVEMAEKNNLVEGSAR